MCPTKDGQEVGPKNETPGLKMSGPGPRKV